jgi:hypothetical protein
MLFRAPVDRQRRVLARFYQRAQIHGDSPDFRSVRFDGEPVQGYFLTPLQLTSQWRHIGMKAARSDLQEILRRCLGGLARLAAAAAYAPALDLCHSHSPP